MANPTIISPTSQEFDGTRYYLCGFYLMRRGVRLHRAVWKAANGAIPKGFHVHHLNGDRFDNRIENLACIRAGDHMALHMTEPARKEMSRRAVRAAIAVAPAWHRSAEGRQWHRQHYAGAVAARLHERKFPVDCQHCGKSFLTVRPSVKFCRPACKTANRFASGIDNETRACAVCAAPFTTNRYGPKATCSTGCAAKAANASRAKRVAA